VGLARPSVLGPQERMLRMDYSGQSADEGPTQPQLARELGISRVTVRRYSTEHADAAGDDGPRPVWDRVGARVAELPDESSQWTGGKPAAMAGS
jgi:hypothetical protein